MCHPPGKDCMRYRSWPWAVGDKKYAFDKLFDSVVYLLISRRRNLFIYILYEIKHRKVTTYKREGKINSSK